MTDGLTGSRIGRRHRHGALLCATLVLGLAAGTTVAHAQINPFRSYTGPVLSREDYNTGVAAARKLLEQDPATLGQSESWAGARSGNHGTFTITRVFERSGMPCRSFRSEVVYRRPARSRNFMLTACQISSGEWKLAD
jgi:surface antigen